MKKTSKSKTSRAGIIDLRTKAGRILKRKRAAMQKAREARWASPATQAVLKEIRERVEAVKPGPTGKATSAYWRVLVGLALLSLLAAPAFAQQSDEACVLSFVDTGMQYVYTPPTPNARLRVTYLTPGCYGSPQFYFSGGMGFSVNWNPGQQAPGVFDVTLVAQEAGGPYRVRATDGHGAGAVDLDVYSAPPPPPTARRQ
jgi:hypothetical protein